MSNWIIEHWLDITTTILGLIYIWLEYKVSILLWIVGIIMPALDIILFWQYGLYGDCGLSVYYLVAAIYGFVVWNLKSKSEKTASTSDPIVCQLPYKLYIYIIPAFLIIWVLTWYILVEYTSSTVPLLDAFTNALSIVGLWALSRKYVEQWIFWVIVDLVSCYLYAVKGIPFKASLFGLYTIIAIAGYFKWKRLSKQSIISNA